MDTSTIILLRPSKDSWPERWKNFKTEYGLPDDDQSSFPIKTIRSAKYAIDYTSLAMQQITDTLQEKFRFEYELRNLGQTTAATTPARRIRGDPLRDAWENARFQTNLDLQITGRSFIGMRLIIPFGD